MVDDHLGEFRGLDRLAVDQRIVDIHRVGDVHQGAVLGGDRRRLVVVVEVAEIFEARFLDEIGRVQRVRHSGREPAAQLAAGEPEMRRLAVLDHLALLLGRIAPVVARVEVAVAHIFPASCFHGFEDVGIHLDHRHRERNGAADRVLVHDLEHAPQADAIAVVAAAVAQHVGMRHARPRIAHPDLGRDVFVMLDIGAGPDRDARALGPAQFRPLDDRGVGEPVRIHWRSLSLWHGECIMRLTQAQQVAC